MELAETIGSTLGSVFARVESKARQKSAFKNEARIELYLHRDRFPIPFATITVNAVREGPVLFLEVTAEREIIDTPKAAKLWETLVEEIMMRYAELRPMVRESITHRYGTVEGNELKTGRRTASRTLKVTFRMLDAKFDTKNGDAYDKDKIAMGAIPYVRALYEIDKRLD